MINSSDFDFSTPIVRRGTGSLKWDIQGAAGAIPMWVADMDFAAPPAVLAALRRRVDHGVFGYALPQESTAAAVVAWLRVRYGWEIRPEWLVWLPGLVPGLHVSCLACAGPGDEIATFTPVYPPFLTAPEATGRKLLTVPLHCDDLSWTMDIAALRSALTDRTRMFVLCHPHNPVGRAWHRNELRELADACRENDLIVCSDEIHCDLVLDERAHVPFAMLDDDTARRTITLMSPAKTFNIAGLDCGFAIIADEGLRTRFQRAMAGLVPHPNALGYAACEAAFTTGEPWRQALLKVLRANRDLLADVLRLDLPLIRLAPVEATFLAWLDCRALGNRGTHAFFREAGVFLSDGASFQGPGFMRLNFGCPRPTLEEALDRLRRAILGPA